MRLTKLSCVLLFCGAVYAQPGQGSDDSQQQPFGVSAEPPKSIPKIVAAHFMVGNTYPYTVDDWKKDIRLAASKGIDAFALNVGRDVWQPDRIADAYKAAVVHSQASEGPKFRLFMSFDMESLPCSTRGDVEALRQYITMYAAHPNQLMYHGKVFVSTFSGQACHFGMGDSRAGWMSALTKNFGVPVHFVPAWFEDPAVFPSLSFLDGVFNWNSAWPMSNTSITFNSDNAHSDNLRGKTYMAGVSPWFFTHYGADSYNKNFIYRADDWLLASRWEQLVQNRHKVDLVEIISWNDYGESHYVGPITGAQPKSEAWTNGYDHQGWLELMAYYIAAFKTGVYPTIMKDRIIMWGRRFPAGAISSDPVGRPDHWQWTQDSLWVVVLLKAPGTIQLACGLSSHKKKLPAGLSKLSLPLTNPCQTSAGIFRGGRKVFDGRTEFTFWRNPPSYNFNALVVTLP